MTASQTPSTTVATQEQVVNLDTGELVSVAVQDPASQIEALKNPDGGIFVTFSANTFEDKLRIFTAVNASVPVMENLNKEILLKDVIAQTVEYRDQDGVLQVGTRLVLIDAAGKAYSAMSAGLYTSVMNILGIMGHPSTWPGPFKCQIVQKPSRNGGFKFFSIIPA